ncbi:MAG: 2-oxo acid dehydrogenase subunit E2 [Bacteroidetes bacterium]|nr:2-oxo acid dehydrogenase subunit E2 [Bacteroidota bacterium]
MTPSFSYQTIPESRIATFDTFSAGMLRHHVAAILEFDVTDSRKKLQELRKNGTNISFNGWLLRVIGMTLKNHPEASAFLYSKRKLLIFDDINISIMIEKKINGNKVPVPVVIEKTNEKSALEITAEIEAAKNSEMGSGDIVINRKRSFSERVYYHLPGFLRRLTWSLILRNPHFAYKKMGNVIVTSLGMTGRINGWFIHRSIHPVSFGIGSVLKKPVVTGNEIKIREILNMTILIDHDVIDGAPMVRLLNELTRCIGNGEGILPSA